MPTKKKKEDEVIETVAEEVEAPVEMTPDPPEEKEITKEQWAEIAKKNEAERLASEKPTNPALVEPKSEEEVVKEQFKGAYTISNWGGHDNYECSKCAFSSLDKFKLYKHLIQAHSGVEQDYRGETTHS